MLRNQKDLDLVVGKLPKWVDPVPLVDAFLYHDVAPGGVEKRNWQVILTRVFVTRNGRHL